MSYLSPDESKLLTDVTTLQRLIAEQPFRHEACPLLAKQLNEVEVLLDKARSKAHQLRAALAARGVLPP